MAIVNSYPIGTPKTNDLIVGTSMPLADTDADPITKNFEISSVLALDHDLILTSPGGTRYKIIVDDAGVLSTTAV
jgi:hypothetical protein